MQQQENRYNELAQKWLDGTITDLEKKEFNEWYSSGQNHPLNVPPEFARSEEELRRRILKAITQNKNQQARIISFRKTSLRVAAASALIAAATVFFYTHKQRNDPLPVTTQSMPVQPESRIEPGGNKAVLVLADGSKVILDTATNGTIAQNQNIRVIKLADGQLAYASLKNKAAAISYNTLSTPRGGQYSISLPDGTKVWLNSASSLRFPSAFAGSERVVELTGEAYFEVAKKASQPFKVKLPEMEVRVLGTHFNVMAYEDEEMIKTTLLEGSVGIQNNTSAIRLKPGQQAQVRQGKINVKEHVDVEEAIAWKNGLFNFEGATIEAVMRQMKRWYNIEVVYKNRINDHFTGTISRNVGIDKVFKMLELTGAVHFIINGNQIIVGS